MSDRDFFGFMLVLATISSMTIGFCGFLYFMGRMADSARDRCHSCGHGVEDGEEGCEDE